MRRHVKALLIGIAVAITMAYSATAAAAITLSPAGSISMESLGLITFRTSGVSWECRYTLNGTLESTVANIEGAHVGSLTSGSANECRGGSWRLLFSGGEWEITLTEETVLPEANESEAGLRISNVQFLFEELGVSCLYTGTVTAGLRARGNPLVTQLLTISGTNVRRTSGSIICPSPGTLAGTFALPTQTLRL